MSKEAVTASAVPGWYGKMPSLGDFASRRLPQEFLSAWDGWLQTQLERSREALGTAWLSTYLVAPVRRFWLAPGLLGANAWVGVLMPSVDSVGRHFPFTIAAALRSGEHGLAVAIANVAWFDAVDRAARQILDPDFDIQTLEQTLAAVSPMSVQEPADPPEPQPLADSVCGTASAAASVWWCEGVNDAAAFQCASGLPLGSDFDAWFGAAA